MTFFKHISVLVLLLVFSFTARGQNIEYGLQLDTNYMLIGDQQHLVFKLRSQSPVQVHFPQLKDTVVSGVEIISGPLRDSVREQDGRWLYQEKYVITSFDTGVYIIPPQPIKVEGEEYDNVLRTEEVGFVVNTYTVDLQKGNYDIVMPYDAPWTFVEILPWLLWGLGGLAVVALLVWLWLRHRRNRPIFAAPKEVIPPYTLAMRSLDEIKSGKLWQAGREKEYYTRLTDTLRQYMDGELGIAAMEQTTSEILEGLSSCRFVDRKDVDKLAELLATADFVKFARHMPLQDENSRYLAGTYDFINRSHQCVEELKAEEEKKRKEEETAARKAGEADDAGKPAGGKDEAEN